MPRISWFIYVFKNFITWHALTDPINCSLSLRGRHCSWPVGRAWLTNQRHPRYNPRPFNWTGSADPSSTSCNVILRQLDSAFDLGSAEPRSWTMLVQRALSCISFVLSCLTAVLLVNACEGKLCGSRDFRPVVVDPAQSQSQCVDIKAHHGCCYTLSSVLHQCLSPCFTSRCHTLSTRCSRLSNRFHRNCCCKLFWLVMFKLTHFYTRKQQLLSAHLSHRSSVRPSICSSVTWVDQLKTVQATITKSLLSAAWKTLVSGTVKLFHKFEGGHPEREH